MARSTSPRAVPTPAKGLPFLVWGAGGHGRVVAELLQIAGHHVVGFVDREPERPATREIDLSVVPEWRLEEALDTSGPLPADARALSLGIGDNAARQRCLEAAQTVQLPPLVHPAAVVSRSARLERGSVIMAGAVVNADAQIGEGAIVNTGAIVEHDCRLGTASHVSPGAVLGGGVTVGDRAWVGLGARVIQGIVVGDNAIVGAGAVVIRDVPNGATVVGMPAKPLPQKE